MKSRFFLSTAIIVFGAMTAETASAAAFVSKTGSGAVCSLAAPCATMGPAVTAAGPNGEVICLDRGGFGGVIITQSITISCGDGLWEAPQGIVSINNTPAGSTVVLEGLVADGAAAPGTVISFNGEGTLDLRHVRIRNNPGASTHGLDFKPTGPAKLVVSDSVFDRNGNSGIKIAPTGAGVAQVNIKNSDINNNGQFGIYVLPASGGKANVALNNVTAVGNVYGLWSGGVSKVTVRGSAFTNNNVGVATASLVDFTDSSASENSTGLATANSPSAQITLARSRIYGNATGLQSNGGPILSFGNNEINGNNVNGAPTAAALPLQ